MADTYIINASNQTVTGTAAGEIFEFDSSLTNGTFTNVIINAAGGKDTIKAGTQSATRQTIDAVVTGLNPSSRLDFGDTYGDNFFYFSTQPDGIHITNENGSYKFKLLGVKNTSSCTGDTKNIFRARQIATPWDDHWLGGNCTLHGEAGDDILICGGSNNTLTGGYGNNAYLMSTGLVNEAAYNPNSTDTVNVTITDAKAGDAYYIRDLGIGGINMSTTFDGIVISSTSGRINVTMKDRYDWNAVKSNLITLDNAQGYIYTCSLERAVAETAARLIPPAGISVSGNYLSVSADFVGNLIMSTAGANYTNNQIVTMDATQNYQVGMQLGGNSNSNAIYAGQGGNILWGGEDTLTDYLFGGAGADVFQLGKTDGNDAVFNAGTNDVIHLHDVSLSDIVSAGIDANTIALGLNSGNIISVANGDAISPTFVLADGSAYRYNRTSNSWQGA